MLLVLASPEAGSQTRADREAPSAAYAPLRGETIDRGTFPNPHAHIPAQCYIETSNGTQNACLFCHTDGVWQKRLGNNNPQAGANPNVGNLQTEYSFGVYNFPFVPNSSINPWANTLQPELLADAVAKFGIDPAKWDMRAYLREDNWRAAYARRPGKSPGWDTGVDDPFRLFPALDPSDLPADDDGFVRSKRAEHGFWKDARGHNTGWRSVNFMPYGIFTPFAGSVSGIYIRLPEPFMKNAAGQFDLLTYEANLELLERNIQDRLLPADGKRYLGAAAAVEIARGQYPLGTEFAHPLHYVDVAADGRDRKVSPFPGTRSKRVKEIRWMYKARPWNPDEFGLGMKDESAPVYANARQGWIENGTGWLLAAWIEDAKGALRPQKPSELVQCVSCHSGNVRQSEVGQHATFTSGTGNTVDATWSFPRKLPGATGWREMDYLGYRAGTPGTLSIPEPKNRGHGRGEFAFFLDHVVGASLYGEMPAAMEAHLASRITRARGYADDWPRLGEAVAAKDVEQVIAIQEKRLALMRAFTAKGEHLDAEGRIRVELLVPPERDALEGARRYRQVVATQRYDFGKDVFPETPLAFRYFRRPADAFRHQDGRPYSVGDVIRDRPINTNPAELTYGVGIGSTLIDAKRPFEKGGTFVPDYVPLLEVRP